MKTELKLLGLVSLIMLSGCHSILDETAPIPKPTTVAHHDKLWQSHLHQLEKIQSYQAKGQFGYISPQERFSSHFDWQYQNPSAFSLVLSSNLSRQSLKLQRTAQGLTVTDHKGNKRSGANVNQLMEEIVGIALPIEQLAFWLKGMPAQSTDYVVNDQRRLASFRYMTAKDRWQVSYISYDETHQPALPKLIVLENGIQTLKIGIDHWGY